MWHRGAGNTSKEANATWTHSRRPQLTLIKKHSSKQQISVSMLSFFQIVSIKIRQAWLFSSVSAG